MPKAYIDMSPAPQLQGPNRDDQDDKSQRTSQYQRRRPLKNINRLQAGIQEFLGNASSQSLLLELNIPNEEIQSALPKRFMVYEPLLLLPANAFQTPPAWGAFYAALTTDQRGALYASIAEACRCLGVTHIAINAPIALTNAQGQENRMRSPVGLIPLYGDFGAPSSASAIGSEDAQPSPADFAHAFWVRTIQNHGIVQVWAPFYTMFSRGNVKEKARILGLGPSERSFAGLDDHTLGQKVSEISVVDMYAGIGYFVFSYLRRGVKRVWGWELNGWSVEGLRRGCEANGWQCKVLHVQESGQPVALIEAFVECLTEADRVVIFQGDNRLAAEVMAKVRQLMETRGTWSPVRHVNLGLLPSSQPSWDNACRVLDLHQGGWLHVHENVDMRDIKQKKDGILKELAKLRSIVHEEHAILNDPTVRCGLVENVKTYAPGVMHCVFDVQISSFKTN
ncbi:uncharacterized protein N7459_003079 [Penicillium hispanicum]|uniref:uncharacterized protein n=1 Tax=Penicillium hispanicum TaxID=1080232 RepID=UPI00253F711F|nr:uncharacterized protein N7459_003079 [Penicillium hispanicum]KAJ5587314.1 hypothetical protein N7459_003079 [Penicillium hispanicum]